MCFVLELLHGYILTFGLGADKHYVFFSHIRSQTVDDSFRGRGSLTAGENIYLVQIQVGVRIVLVKRITDGLRTGLRIEGKVHKVLSHGRSRCQQAAECLGALQEAPVVVAQVEDEGIGRLRFELGEDLFHLFIVYRFGTLVVRPGRKLIIHQISDFLSFYFEDLVQEERVDFHRDGWSYIQAVFYLPSQAVLVLYQLVPFQGDDSALNQLLVIVRGDAFLVDGRNPVAPLDAGFLGWRVGQDIEHTGKGMGCCTGRVTRNQKFHAISGCPFQHETAGRSLCLYWGLFHVRVFVSFTVQGVLGKQVLEESGRFLEIVVFLFNHRHVFCPQIVFPHHFFYPHAVFDECIEFTGAVFSAGGEEYNHPSIKNIFQ